MEEGTDAAALSSASQQEQQESSGDQHTTSTPGPTAPAPSPAQAEDEASDAASVLAGLALTSSFQGAEGEEGGGEGSSIAATLDTSQDGTPPGTTDDNNNSSTAASFHSPPPPPSSPAATAPNTGKVKVQLMAVGRAPRLAQSKFIVQAKDSFRALFPVLRRLLQLREDQALFVFVNSAFAPAPEDKFGDLFQCFGKTGTLIVNYSLDEAWG